MNELSGASYSDQANWTYSHYPNQIGQSSDGVILLVAERFSIAAQHRYICAGPIGALAREVGVYAAVGVPILGNGRVRGLAAVGSMQRGPMAADTEVRISRFAELSASAVAAKKRPSASLCEAAKASSNT